MKVKELMDLFPYDDETDVVISDVGMNLNEAMEIKTVLEDKINKRIIIVGGETEVLQ